VSGLVVEDVRPGTSLPPLTVQVTPVQMFLYSAASHNGHRIHWDTPWATEVEGHPGLVVQGHLQAALLARLVTDWIGGDGRLVAFATRHRGSAYAGDVLTFRGEVVAVRHEENRHLVDLRLGGENAAGEVILPGTATVELPSRSG
jgi:acyl dehydratase